MEGVRTGPKKPEGMSVSTKRDLGSLGETNGKHNPCCAPNSGPGGEGVHGMPLFSHAAKKAGD
jgi:hypothetical protein